MDKQQVRIALKRVYDEPELGDGTRVLVERLWPRGLSKERAHIDLWLKEIAPSRELRTWFGHDPAKFAEFRRRYEAELADAAGQAARSEEHTSELQSHSDLVCRLLLEKKKNSDRNTVHSINADKLSNHTHNQTYAEGTTAWTYALGAIRAHPDECTAI